MRERRERAVLPVAEPTLHRKPEFVCDEDPHHVELRKAVENFINRGGTIKVLPPQAAPMLNLGDETINILEDTVLRNAEYGIHRN